MTKAGFKSVTIPENLYSILMAESKKQNISIGKLIERGVIGDSSPSSRATPAVVQGFDSLSPHSF